jgi:hypothetical protein
MTQEVLKLSQEALAGLKDVEKQVRELIAENKALKEALKEHAMREVQRLGQEIEQEPVALESLLGAIARGWCHEKNASKEMDSDLAMAIATEVKTFYATPPQRTWVGLTDEEYTHITDTVFHTGQGLVAYYKAIEAKLKELNT